MRRNHRGFCPEFFLRAHTSGGRTWSSSGRGRTKRRPADASSASAWITQSWNDVCRSLIDKTRHRGSRKECEDAAYIFCRVRLLLLLELNNPECDLAAWTGYELYSLDDEKVFTEATVLDIDDTDDAV